LFEGSPFQRTSPQKFVAGRDTSKRKAFLSGNSAEDLKHHKTFTSHQGKAGYALDKHKDLQNVFNNSGKRGIGSQALTHAIKHGAKTLDAYDGHLPRLYAKHGFVETGRLKFNDEHAPKDWNYEKHGRPDVVFMAYKGGDRKNIESRQGKFAKPQKSRYHNSYEEAKRHQHFVALSSDRQKPMMAKPKKVVKEDVDTMQNNVSMLIEQLPANAQAWIRSLRSDARSEMERVLTDTGVENFTKYWQEHKADLEEAENSFKNLG
jgi:hypothetical protein